MKVTKEHQQQIRDAISQYDTEAARENYRQGNFPRSETVIDLDKRYRWDLYWYCLDNDHMPDMVDNCYSMDYIDTALRSIVKPLEA